MEEQIDLTHSPTTSWPWWSAVVALLGGLLLAAVGALVIDLPALAFGVEISSSHTPPGLAIAGTFVQDVMFVLAAVWCARMGGRTFHASQLGLRKPGVRWRSVLGMLLLLLLVFLLFSLIWVEVFKPKEEELLKTLGSNESALLLVLSAALTCVVAPVCEEILFRGYIFTALRNLRGTLLAALVTGFAFGGVHAGSAPALDLIPLAALGFGLCLLYHYTGSLYPSIVAHSLNNSIAFSQLEHWDWQTPVLMVSALLALAVLRLTFKSGGLIESPAVGAGIAGQGA